MNFIKAKVINHFLFFILFCVSPVSAQDHASLRIGAIFPFTGKEARQGQLGRVGVELALSEFGREFQPEVRYEDSQSSAINAVSAFNRLQLLSGVDVVLTMGSPTAMALLPLANRSETVLLAMAVVPGFSAPNDFGFRLMGTASSFSKRMVKTLTSELGKKRIAVLACEDDYGSGYANYLEPELARLGILAGVHRYLPSIADYRSQLTKVKASKPDAIILGSWAAEAGTLLRQSKEIHLDPDLFACPGACDNPDLITASGTASDRVLIFASSGATTEERKKTLEEKFGEKPTSVVLRFYDAMVLLKNADAQCRALSSVRGECIKNALASTKNVQGSSYPITVDANGDIVEEYQLKVIRDGKFVAAQVKGGQVEVE